MTTVGAYEAKTHFSQLLERVSRGERITILRHGVPVAVLAPVSARGDQLDEAIARIRELRKGTRLAPDTLRELIEEGRR